uniref:probable LRR receptor-like serine/threonine-protein kinase At3g47570 n=1 Tax=Fragaria vesca subsp. vesca TaxID=101020 RepID=UPI0005C9809D|nr:PREDICTED: probable LRR receptor-like serine/threonine-protein kinase At3g47570 [Fragaria vesca subsp. vesca]
MLQVSYNTLLKATDGFSASNLIGAGSFGSVYKGVLGEDGAQLVAVKVFNMLRRGASKSFLAECEALKNIRHRNLVPIITACSSVDSQSNDFKALVYKFMENGSLEEWLHPTNGTENTPKSLSLVQRLDIAIDVASAVDYLHNHCETSIVHCDLKPSNVLLDNNLTGHVADFGLARILSRLADNVSANQSSSIGIRGTVGYAASEYGMGEVRCHMEMSIALLARAKLSAIQQDIASNSSNDINFEAEVMAKAEVLAAVKRQEAFWRDRARVKWFTEGDKCSKFFHAYARNKAMRSSINCLKAGDNLITAPQGIASHVVEFY